MLVLVAGQNPYRISPARIARLTLTSAVQFLRKLNTNERAKTPRLVVIHLTLPQRDGFWLLGEIKNDGELQRIRVVVVGVEPRADYEPKVLALGAQYYVEKSFDYEIFAQHVKAACEFLNCP